MHKSAVAGQGAVPLLQYNVGGEGIRADREDRQGASVRQQVVIYNDVQPHCAVRLQDPRGPLANGWAGPSRPRTAVIMPSSLLGFFLRLVGDWMWYVGNTMR